MQIYQPTASPSNSLFKTLNLSDLPRPVRAATVGSGGKTSLLFALAKEARTLGFSVLLMPSTHMQRPEKFGVFTGNPEDTLHALFKDGFAIAGLPVSAPSPIAKISFPGWETYEAGKKAADLILLEADGSRRLPLKYPAAFEPVLPPDCSLILAVSGLSSLGKEPQRVCHRLSFAQAALKKSPWDKVSQEDLALLMKKGYLEPLRSRFPASQVLPVFHQADNPALIKAGLETLKNMGEPEGLVTFLEPEERL